jgi:glutamate synthase (ferredoxin)
MTGGRVVILGSVGRNFAAGMSGGIAYVLDDGSLKSRCNFDMVSLAELDGLDIVTVHSMLSKHVEYTGSPIGIALLEKWQDSVKRFVKVLPNDYAGMLQAMEQAEHEGYSGEAQLKRAFAIKTGAKE